MRTGTSEIQITEENIAEYYEKGRDSVADALTFLTSPNQRDFFAKVINSLDRLPLVGFGTMAVTPRNGKYILIYDPIFASLISYEELRATLEHEVLHILLSHIPRYMRLLQTFSNDYDKYLINITVNIAMDLADNELLAKNWKDIKDPNRRLGYWVIPENFDPHLPYNDSFENYQKLLHALLKHRLKSSANHIYQLARAILKQRLEAMQKALQQGNEEKEEEEQQKQDGENAKQEDQKEPGKKENDLKSQEECESGGGGDGGNCPGQNPGQSSGQSQQNQKQSGNSNTQQSAGSQQSSASQQQKQDQTGSDSGQSQSSDSSKQTQGQGQQGQSGQDDLDKAMSGLKGLPSPGQSQGQQGQQPQQQQGQGQGQNQEPSNDQGQGQDNGQGQGQGQADDVDKAMAGLKGPGGQGSPSQGNGQGNAQGQGQIPQMSAEELENQISQLDAVDQKILEMLVNSMGSHVGWDNDLTNDAASHQLEEHGREVIRNAVKSQQKSRGTIPGHYEELIRQMLLPPTVPWTQFLHNIVQRTRQTKKVKGMARPSKKLSAIRKFAQLKFEEAQNQPEEELNPMLRLWSKKWQFIQRMAVFPGIKHENKFTIVYAVDTSGSMGTAELQRGLAELQHIQKSDSDVTIIVLYADTRICKEYVLGPTGQIDAKMTGRGGTDFEHVFTYIKERLLRNQEKAPDILVYCTDGYAPEPITTLPIPTVWLITPRGRPCCSKAGHITIEMRDYQLGEGY